MSKNLLIGLGDSWTQGVGSYTQEYLKLTNNITKHIPKTDPMYYTYLRTVQERFHKYSWPAVCASKLNCDFINLGAGGSANSTVAKLFLHETHMLYKQNYDKVDVVFLITDPFRFSFYAAREDVVTITLSGLQVKNDEIVEHNYKKENILQDFLNWYVDTVDENAAARETAFYLRCVEYFCKLYGYNFYWGSAFSPIEQVLYNYSSHNCLHYEHFKNFKEYIFSKMGKKAFSPCAHPNELGYELIGNFIAEELLLRDKN